MTWTRLTQTVVAFAALGAFGVSAYNVTQIKEVHLIMNSRLTELLDLTRKAATAEGLKLGREEKR